MHGSTWDVSSDLRECAPDPGMQYRAQHAEDEHRLHPAPWSSHTRAAQWQVLRMQPSACNSMVNTEALMSAAHICRAQRAQSRSAQGTVERSWSPGSYDDRSTRIYACVAPRRSHPQPRSASPTCHSDSGAVFDICHS